MSQPERETRGEPAPDPRVGTTLSGKYIVKGILGRGGMGTVYECLNVSIGRVVAIKVLSERYAERGEIVGRFQREARAAARIGHPNIVDVFDMGRTDDGQPYLVMERLEGQDLSTLLEREKKLPIAAAVDILTQVLGALGAAHSAGIVHRDVKPENVFLARRGPRTDFVKVVDFGVAKFHDIEAEESTRLTRAGSIIGTPAYMAPEQARQRAETDSRSDLYAAGVMLYEMLSGRLPLAGETANEMLIAVATVEPTPIREVAPETPERLAAIVTRALAKDPAQRFQTAAEFVHALEPFQDTVGLEVLDAKRSDVRTPRRFQTDAPTITTESEAPDLSGPTVIGDFAPEPAPARGRRLWLVGALVVVAAVVAGAVLTSGPTPRARAADSGALERTRAASTPVSLPPPSLLGPAGDAAAPPSAQPAPAPAPAPAMVSLDVTAEVAGAQVLLDEAVLGVTPVHTVVAAQEGLHRLEVRAEGYDPAVREIPLAAPLQVEVELTRVDAEPSPAGGGRRRRPRHGPRAQPGLIYDGDVYHRP